MQPRTERRGPLISPSCRQLLVLSGHIAIRVKHGLGTLYLLPIYKRVMQCFREAYPRKISRMT